jgi:WD40 repeat protein
MRSIKLGGRKQLEDSELDSLREAIAKLPAPPSRPDPERWLLVSGIRSNEWLTSIYDRRDIPQEVERLFAITGAPIVWDVPQVQSSAKTAARPSDWRPGYIDVFKTAAHAPVAVSGSGGSIQVWDLRQPPDQRTPDTETFEGTGWQGSAVAISTDGSLIAAGREEIARAIYAVETATGKVRWRAELPQFGPDKVVQDLAFVGTNQLLAVQFLNSIELWDTSSGHRHAVLTSLEGEHPVMQSSRDGRCLAVLLDRGNFEPAHIKIWDFAEPGSVHEIVESHPAYGIRLFAFSPDNRYLALGSPSSRAI